MARAAAHVSNLPGSSTAPSGKRRKATIAIPANTITAPAAIQSLRLVISFLALRQFERSRRAWGREAARNAGEPGRESRTSSELIQITESLQERVLHGFCGVLGIAEDRQRHAKHSSLVPPHQRFQTRAGLRQNAVRQLQIVFVPHRLFAWFAAWHAHPFGQDSRGKGFNGMDLY
ncbi:MAG TPA: hypothetical protein VF748_08835 [Candidatus Acidoferrum sp.]